MDNIEKLLTDRVFKAINVLVLASKAELSGQGHRLTGSLINSINSDVAIVAGAIKADVFINDYGLILDGGVKPNRIPYQRGSGKGSSKFITALIDYFTKRGKSSVEAKRAAFATAQKQKKEGMPTRGSYRYATNGRRLNWRKEAIMASESKIKEALDFLGDLEKIINQLIEN